MKKGVKIKRVYEQAEKDDGYRMLVDRLWPRGLSKEDAHYDEWNKEIAPSPELRKWFGHDKKRFGEFTERYLKELKAKQEELDRILTIAEDKPVTLLYAAKDTAHNHGLVLRDVLEPHK